MTSSERGTRPVPDTLLLRKGSSAAAVGSGVLRPTATTSAQEAVTGPDFRVGDDTTAFPGIGHTPSSSIGLFVSGTGAEGPKLPFSRLSLASSLLERDPVGTGGSGRDRPVHIELETRVQNEIVLADPGHVDFMVPFRVDFSGVVLV